MDPKTCIYIKISSFFYFLQLQYFLYTTSEKVEINKDLYYF